MSERKWKDLKNILCIRTDNLGDVVMTSPAIRALKENNPDRKITLLTSSSGREAAKILPYIDEVLVYDFPWMNRIALIENVEKAITVLKEKKFDAAVIFTVYSQNPLPAALMCRQAGIDNIAAYCRENPYGLLSNWIPDPEPIFEIKHEAERQMDLVRSVGEEVNKESYSIYINPEVEQRAKRILEEEGFLKDKKYLIIHPGVSEQRRKFSIEILAEALTMIYRQTDFQFVLTGVEKEKELTGFINQELGGCAIDLAGKLNIEELAAVIKNAEALISNNTGPVHLAAATQTPVLVLYALTNPQHLPWKTTFLALPFDVPAENRSKNVIIEYTYQKVFKEKPLEIKAVDIVNCFMKLLELKTRKAKTDIFLV